MNTIKKLTRPRNGRMLGGVCAGIGEYLGIDPTVVRIICVLLSIGTIGLALLVAVVVVGRRVVVGRLRERGGAAGGQPDGNDEGSQALHGGTPIAGKRKVPAWVHIAMQALTPT